MNVYNGPDMRLYIQYNEIFLIVSGIFDDGCLKTKKFKWIDELDQFVLVSCCTQKNGNPIKDVILMDVHSRSSVVFFKNDKDDMIREKSMYKTYTESYFDHSFQKNSADSKWNIVYYISNSQVTIDYRIKNKYLHFVKSLIKKECSFYYANKKGYHNIGSPAVIKFRGKKIYKRFYKNGKDSMQIEALKNPEILFDPAYFEVNPDDDES